MRILNLIGINGLNDIDMVELCGGANLALEAAHGKGIGQAILANDLEGDAAAQFPVARLEDLAHAAFADPLDQQVGAEQQLLAATGENLIGLKRRDPAAPEQFPGQAARVGKT